MQNIPDLKLLPGNSNTHGLIIACSPLVARGEGGTKN